MLNLDFGGIGAAGTPGLMSAMSGASDPMRAYLQNQQGSSPYNTNQMQDLGLGFNIPTMQLALGGLNTIGNMWMAWQANKLAKDQFKMQKNVAQANISNQISAYNTALEDRSRSRAFTEGQSPEQAQAYIDDNRLDRVRL